MADELDDLKKLVDAMDELVAEGAVETDPEKARELLKAARKKACLFITKLNREIADFVRETIEDMTGESGAAVAINLEDAIASHPTLAVFRSATELRRFLDASTTALKRSGLSTRRVERLAKQVQEQYANLREQALNSGTLIQKLQRLEDYYCPGPDGPGGPGSGSGGGGGSGGGRISNETTEQRIWRYATGLATIGAFIVILLQVSARVKSLPGAEGQEQLPTLNLLGVLLLASLHDDLTNQGELPQAVAQPGGDEPGSNQLTTRVTQEEEEEGETLASAPS